MKKLVEKNNLRNGKGITLIALVITIIVLLILAGVAVGMLRTDNSILSQSRNAKNSTNKAQVQENVQLALYDAVGNAAVEGGENPDISSYLLTALQAYYSNITASDITSNGYTLSDGTTTSATGYTVTINVSDEESYIAAIDTDGKLVEVYAAD